MAFTLGTEVVDTVYRVNLTLRDQLNEEIRKVTTLHNAATGEGVQDAMQAFEALTDAGLVKASASIQAGVSGASTTIGTSGIFSVVSTVMVLGFERAHPLNSAITVSTVFTIPAPVATIYSGTDIVIGTDPGDFASAASVPETLAALIAYLEDHLTYEDITGAVTVGGWTYAPGRSGILSDGRILDGVPNT